MSESKYEKHYSDEGFWAKLKKSAKDAGSKVVYSGLLLYYAVQSPKTPLKARVQIYGALGYLILPIDLVPDFLPVVGYVDDLGALGLALGAVAQSIDQEVKQKAKDKLKDLFGEEALKSQEVMEVDSEIVVDSKDTEVSKDTKID
ncbi:YkvA family protein [Cohnella mopanensis]|uniref:YkvA family protein n=1 Tax=Cohnella mopanensis TaxID=2911966 RepID=UPI001EF79D07|nr:YkvA family protein [Cohnella mopanensis]